MGTRLDAIRFLALIAPLALTAHAFAADPGFIDDFNGGIGPYFGAELSWVTTGGVDGAGDGYMAVARTTPGNLGVTTDRSEVTGDLIADGVTGFSFWLNNLGDNDPLEIHVGVGNATVNFWLYKPGFVPPSNSWQQFSVDFSNPADWIQIHGSGTFTDALKTSTRLLLRHDVAPFTFAPDEIVGDFGVDNITVVPEPASVLLLLSGAPLLRRRR